MHFGTPYRGNLAVQGRQLTPEYTIGSCSTTARPGSLVHDLVTMWDRFLVMTSITEEA